MQSRHSTGTGGICINFDLQSCSFNTNKRTPLSRPLLLYSSPSSFFPIPPSLPLTHFCLGVPGLLPWKTPERARCGRSPARDWPYSSHFSFARDPKGTVRQAPTVQFWAPKQVRSPVTHKHQEGARAAGEDRGQRWNKGG